MANQPKVSIVVPIYGVEKYLRQCVDSILAQTLKDIEIILVDDGSKDKCPEIVDEYAKKDPRIVVIHQTNGGYGNAMNHGISVATGEYIGIVEPDDFIDKNMFEDLYSIANKNNSDIVKSAYWEIYDSNSSIVKKYAYWCHEISATNKPFSIEECPVFFYHHPSIWSCIYKAKFIKDNNFRFVEAKGGGWVDNPWQVETLCMAKKINWTPQAYYNYRPQSEGNSSKLTDYNIPINRFNEIHDFLEKHQTLYKKIFFYLTKKEIAYLYNAFKVGFSTANSLSDVKLLEKKLKNLLSRIPPLTPSFSKTDFKLLKKMKNKNYTIKYLKRICFK